MEQNWSGNFWADYVLVVYFLGIIGLMNFSQDWTVIRALNPYYALQLLVSPENKLGLFILGNIFLATTGAEALYSDLGHVGK